ncbi:MAG: M55 family metallopeptidase [Haliea sp.]
MRVLFSAYMEGVSGVVSRPQTDDYESADYARARSLFEEDVCCAVEAALGAGAEEVVIADSHGSATNLDPRSFPAQVRLVQGWPRPLGMMQGIESGSYAAAILLGYHTAITTIGGNFPHSFSSGQFRAVRFNGEPVSEGHVSAWLAGHFSVPVVAASGDDACMAELAAAIPGLSVAVTKFSRGMYSAEQLSREYSHAAIRAAVVEGLNAAPGCQPRRLEGAIELELELHNRYLAQLLSYLPGFNRVAAGTVACRARDIVEAMQIVGALVHLQADGV